MKDAGRILFFSLQGFNKNRLRKFMVSKKKMDELTLFLAQGFYNLSTLTLKVKSIRFGEMRSNIGNMIKGCNIKVYVRY